MFERLGFTSKKRAKEMAVIAAKRGYAAAMSKARYGDFTASKGSANYELRQGLAKVREKCRYLARNSPAMVRFLGLLDVNVIGAHGIRTQSRVRQLDGKLDKSLNSRVENEFNLWWKRPTACGQMTGRDFLSLVLKSEARDGECFVEIVISSKYHDRLALNIIEADQIDETLNTKNPKTGNQIIMGVEVDGYRKPVAYHVLTNHPGDMSWFSTYSRKNYRIVPAERMIHKFIRHRAGQVRGEPWASSVVNDIKMVDGNRESETVSRRIRSAVMGFFTKENPATDGISELADDDLGVVGADEPHSLEMSVEPGVFRELPAGMSLSQFDPGGLETDYSEFEAQLKKSIAQGFMISVMTHGMETKGVSYSAGRTVVIEDRDFYMLIQESMKSYIMDRVFSVWLDERIAQPESDIPPTRLDAIKVNVRFQARGWSWVDPAKEVKATVDEIDNKITSISRVCASKGIDRDELFAEIADDEDSLRQYGLTRIEDQSSTEPQTDDSNDEDGESDENDEDDT
jgi:lambda family phage portal protein